VDPAYERVGDVFDHLDGALRDLFPAGRRRAHHASLGWAARHRARLARHRELQPEDRASASQAGYVGDGLSTTNLAGRTLADLVLGREHRADRAPVGEPPLAAWEPEPLRFAGANLGILGMQFADLEERVTRRHSVTARVLAPLTGH
jgi:glycine/D-amino acid oxidase-like deaminating enzyme